MTDKEKLISVFRELGIEFEDENLIKREREQMQTDHAIIAVSKIQEDTGCVDFYFDKDERYLGSEDYEGLGFNPPKQRA